MKMDIVLFFWIINSVFFSSETCCDFQGDLYKAIKVKRKAGTLGLVTNEKSQVSLYCAFSSNHAASFSFALNI